MTDSELLEEALTALCLIRTWAIYNGGAALLPRPTTNLCNKVLDMATKTVKESKTTKPQAPKAASSKVKKPKAKGKGKKG